MNIEVKSLESQLIESCLELSVMKYNHDRDVREAGTMKTAYWKKQRHIESLWRRLIMSREEYNR